ncbi:hypothetical protein [Sinanaerobacter chloroacetimidivorans]|nr:hypothetical protein [Sinanaerobacter chloroacetimidivorans]
MAGINSRYYVKDSHPAIASAKVFDKVGFDICYGDVSAVTDKNIC